MNRKYVYLVSPLLFVALGAQQGCGPQPQPTQAKNVQAERAERAANSISFTDNAEIDNIKKRLELTANPGLLGFIVLLNETGQPVLYEGVVGKVTSGEKRLTKPYIVKGNWDCGEWACDKELPAPSDEGTFGHSGPYIFYWNTEGVYRQWAGKYLYSDKPIRLRIEPLVITSVKE